MSDMPLTERWHRASAVLEACGDILAARPEAEAPGWAVERGWRRFLAAVDDAALARCEADGLASHLVALDAPADLAALVTEAAAVCRLPALGPAGSGAPTRRVKPRKRRQLAAFAAAIAARDLPSRRIVDVGAGHGHLTRHLAEALRIEALGLERDPERITTARRLAGALARFEAVDLFAESPTFAADDLVVGLHACGALTDRLVTRAAEVGAAVAFASCCLQKRPEDARMPFEVDGPLGARRIPRVQLGLANISLGPQGVEASLRANIDARARRAGLRVLLRGRGFDLAPGDEMHGINRRRAHDGYADFAGFALAHRGLPPASAAELRESEATGRRQHDAIRRWSLGRRWLGRLIEVQINCDRGMHLERRGYAVEVGALWPVRISPRNVGVIGARAA